MNTSPFFEAEDVSLTTRIGRLVTLRDPNTRIVILATMLLGFAAGVVGVFMVLRRRALIGDVVGHSALPGIGITFLLLELHQAGSGRQVPWLMLGAFVAGLIGAGCTMLIERFSKIKADAALAIVLSIFYGSGAVLLSMAQKLPEGASAGLQEYLSGKTASLVRDDAILFALLAAILLALTMALFKEWVLLCFDDGFAAAAGRPVFWLDTLLISLVAFVSIIGMQSVGLILVVALLIIPASTAKFWTNRIRSMVWLAGSIGGASGLIGVAISSIIPKAPAGPTIVLVGATAFLFSLIFGRRGGLYRQWQERRRLRQKIVRQDLLRSCYEIVEESLHQRQASALSFSLQPLALTAFSLTPQAIARQHSWNGWQLTNLLEKATRDGLLTTDGHGHWYLTSVGADEAMHLARNHRLWELFLMHYADVAAEHVHKSADFIEHALDAETIIELERLLAQETTTGTMPPRVDPQPVSTTATDDTSHLDSVQE
ncbi:MAG: iron chelate uptake ABC transporter family permease subunit [Planctomycetaceae bacterium]